MNETLLRLPFTGYGLVCALGAALSLALTLPGTLRAGRDWAAWVRFAVCMLFFGWLGARLMFAVPDLLMGLMNELGLIREHNSIYLHQIGSAVPALYFWEGGYALAGAIPGAILGAKLAEKWAGTGSGFFRDRLALTVPAFVLAERLAEWDSGVGVGAETTWQWLIDTGLCPKAEGAFYHPLYLYEALLAAAVLIAMAALEIRRAGREEGGDRLRLCLLLFCLPMVAIEALRPLTGHMIIHFVNVTQVVMMVLALSVTVRWSCRLRKRGRQRPGRTAALLAAAWLIILGAVALAVYCIFGMEKDWVSRPTAYLLIALSMLAVGAVTALLHRFAGRKGVSSHGTRQDPADQ